jgi:MFS family permease
MGDTGSDGIIEGGATAVDQGRVGLKNLPRNVWIVTATSFLNDISSEMLLNLMPLFLFNVLGVRTSVIGLIEGVAETVASGVKVFSGWLSDRIGRRKSLAVLGYGLSTIAKPFLYAATNWGWVMGVRFTDRVGKGLRTAPRDALVADSINEKQRGLAFGLHRAGDTAGAVVGLIVTLGVVWFAQREAALTRATFQIVVLVSLVPAILAVLVLALGAQDVPGRVSAAKRPPVAAERSSKQEDQTSSVRGRRFAWGKFDSRFRMFIVIVVIFTLGNSSDAFLILRAQTTGMSVIGVLGMMILFNLIYTLISTPAGAISDRVGRRWLLVGGWVFYALVYLGFARAEANWHAWTLMAAYGAYYGLVEGVAKAYVADLVPPGLRGTAYGVYNAAVGLMALPASLIAGILWQGVGDWAGWGPGAPFYFGAILALLAALMIAFFMPRRRIDQQVSP